MMRRMTILFLSLVLILFLTIPSLALTKEERAWKEDILTLLSLVERVGDYSEVVDLIELAPSLKEDPEIRKAFVTFAPPGAVPPEWAREEKEAPTEVPKKIAIAETMEKVSRRESEQVSEEEQRMREKERREMEKREAEKIAQEVSLQREAAPPEIIKQEPKIVTLPPPKLRQADVKAPVWPPDRQKEGERREREEGIKEELGVRPTSLPEGAKVIHSTDVVSGVKAEMVEGKMRVTITLSGERKYTISERTRPPGIIIDIPHAINAISPGIIPINKGGIRMIKAIQHRCLPFDEARIIIVLNKWVEYKVKSKDNEIHIEFEGGK